MSEKNPEHMLEEWYDKNSVQTETLERFGLQEIRRKRESGQDIR